MQMQTPTLKKTVSYAPTTFSTWSELEALLEEAEYGIEQGHYEPWDEAFAETKLRYSG